MAFESNALAQKLSLEAKRSITRFKDTHNVFHADDAVKAMIQLAEIGYPKEALHLKAQLRDALMLVILTAMSN